MADNWRDEAARRALSGEAWDDFCEQLKSAGRHIEAWGDVPTDADRAEYYRYLSRLARNGLERFVENCEPASPRLRDTPFRCSINAQTPDQDHLLSEWHEPGHEYRLTGRRGTNDYFIIGVWSAAQGAEVGARDWGKRGVDGLADFDPADLTTTGFLASQDIVFEDDGSFEVLCTREKPEGATNWLQIAEDSVGLLIRVVYQDRASETGPTIGIERLDEHRRLPIAPDQLASNLARSGQMVLGYADLPRRWWDETLHARMNRLEFSKDLYLSNGGVNDRHHAFAAWDVPGDRSLVHRFRVPQCDYWIFQLLNIFQENLDNYEDGQGHVNNSHATVDADGNATVIVSARDPGFGNWIDRFGHAHGTMSLRFVKCPEAPPEVSTWIVPDAALAADGEAALTEERRLS